MTGLGQALYAVTGVLTRRIRRVGTQAHRAEVHAEVEAGIGCCIPEARIAAAASRWRSQGRILLPEPSETSEMAQATPSFQASRQNWENKFLCEATQFVDQFVAAASGIHTACLEPHGSGAQVTRLQSPSLQPCVASCGTWQL